jgi:3-oxoacyl-[acyl-carrier-protein] synthase II
MGMADLMLCGGAEAAITPLTVSGFANMKALSKGAADPKKSSRPFDKNRDGFVIGEGAGVLVLETLEHAQKRGAKIFAEVVGYGLSGDAYHITTPAPGGEGAKRAMEAALISASISPHDVGYINAHGTSTGYNDKLETEAIYKVFGDRIPVSSTKGVTGHCLGAAGGIEAVFLVKSLMNQIIPPTAHFEEKDPECFLDYVVEGARKLDFSYGLSNSFGFGGTNSSLVMKKFHS